jgi:hypothetical protein
MYRRRRLTWLAAVVAFLPFTSLSIKKNRKEAAKSNKK